MNGTSIGHRIRDLLLRLARRTRRPSQEILQYYAMERLLYRISASEYRQRFILKGGMLINAWSLGLFRGTKDIDLLGRLPNRPTVVSNVFSQIVTEVYDDGVEYLPDTIRVREIQARAKYHGLRVSLEGRIARSKVFIHSDLGFSDCVSPKAESLTFPTLLDMPSPHLLSYTSYSVVAEKVDTMLQLGLLNSRMKDFFDVQHLASHVPFNLEKLVVALKATFANRGTVVGENPLILRAEFGADAHKQLQWQRYCEQNRFLHVGAFVNVAKGIAAFLRLPLSCLNTERFPAKTWHPQQFTWLVATNG